MAPPGRAFDHVLIVMFENQYREYVIANDYFRGLAAQGIDLAGMHGVFHPSQTNYIASIAGELCNVTDDEPQALRQETIVDLIERKGLRWKAYMDGWDPATQPWSEGFVPQDQYPYVVKHNPFASFSAIYGSRERWANVVGEDQLWRDLRAGELPEYCFFSPDMWNDGHFTRGTEAEPADRRDLVDQCADWLQWFFTTLQDADGSSLLPPRTLVVITFDEADFEAEWSEDVYDGPNQVYTVLLGDELQPGVEHECYNHYSVLRTIEENFDLGTLGKNDAGANWFRFLWGERFEWSAPSDVGLVGTGRIAATQTGDVLSVVQEDGTGGLELRSWDGTGWGAPSTIVAEGALPAMATCGTSAVLAYQPPEGGVSVLSWTPEGGWSGPIRLIVGDAVTHAIAPCALERDLIVAFADRQRRLFTIRYRDGKWEDAITTGHETYGPLAIASSGHGSFLFHAHEPGPLMQASYNTAPFNIVVSTGADPTLPYEHTTKDVWSPGMWPVAHFTAASTPITPGVLEPSLQPYRAAEPIVAAEMDGVLHLVHALPGTGELATETFSLSGVLTPSLPVWYRGGDSAQTSNGYGTMAEAGWSEQVVLPGAEVGPAGVAAMTRFDDSIVLFVSKGPGAPVRMLTGRYRMSTNTTQ